MYLPYLRGKQFELLALREMISLMTVDRSKISPVIEPVKRASSSLEKCMSEMAKANINFSIVVNPSVGELDGNHHSEHIIRFVKDSLKGYENFQLAFLINSEKSWADIYDIMEIVDFPYGGIMLIHNCEFKDVKARIESIDRMDRNRGVKFNLINYSNTSRRYHRNFTESTKISFDDYFKSKERNADYSKNEDEVFSDEYKYFSEEGFTGFSDYLTLGSGYNEGGFMPYAVAIHLTYLGNEEAIKIRHFVCDSVEDASDTPGKFTEALDKLITWLGSAEHSTGATEEFRQLHLNKHFPGLGTIKKLSIKNHIQLILKLI